MKKNIDESNKKEIDTSHFELYKEIVEKAHNEILFVRSAYKWLLSLVAILIIVGLYFSYKSTRDYRQDLKEEGEKTKNELLENYKSLEYQLRSDLNQMVFDIKNQVENRINEEFRNENIHKLIEDKSIQKVEKFAYPLINDKLNNSFIPKIDSAVVKLNDLDMRYDIFINDIQDITSFMLILLAAQNDNRLAFEQLQIMALDSLYTYRSIAFSAWLNIIDIYNQPFVSKYRISEEIGIDSLSLNSIRNKFDSYFIYDQLGILDYVAESNRFNKKEKMEFIIDIYIKTKSIKVTEKAGKLFTQFSGQKVKPLAIKFIIDWWESNKHNI